MALWLRGKSGWDVLPAHFSTADSSGLANFALPSRLPAAGRASQAAGGVGVSPLPRPSLRILEKANRSLRAAGAAGGASGCGGDESNCTTVLRDRANAEETEPISAGRAGPR